MPTYRFEAEVTISSLHSPGTWLTNRDDVYLSIEAFNIVKRTRLSEAIFPIILHERFSFERTFFSALCPREVCELLEDIPVTIELRQVTDVYLGGTLLAYFDTNARDLFAPCPSLCAKTETDRELLMRRTIDFPGISPRLEFSTYSVIRGFPPYNHACCVSYPFSCQLSHRPMTCAAPARPHPCEFEILQVLFRRHRCCLPHEPNYTKPTVTSALRARPRSSVGFIDHGS
ncbi:hypothetical protein Ciccas_011452 [Cichlidogyrus casuarinus]|uniref:Spermatogenesis-associated protein 6 N-terminal domain-containing protein n=1 Tax=Cichlidogyrus casuarinus TaxID=1844966 RepID=A0ABD2PTA1_9PLAT